MTHVLHGVRVLLLVEVVVKRSHVGLFEIGLTTKTETLKLQTRLGDEDVVARTSGGTHRFGLGEASEGLDGLGDEGEGP